MTLPPLGNPARSQIIRSLHQTISTKGSASFRNTALRVGISEAEVMYAHAEVCKAIAPIELDHHALWEIICQRPQSWYLQIGDLGGSIKICDNIDELHLFGDTLLMNGHNWQLNIKRLSQCHGFVVGCHNPRVGTRITICDSFGRAQAVLLSTSGEHSKEIKQKLHDHAKKHPKLNAQHYYERAHNNVAQTCETEHSFDRILEDCRKLNLPVTLKRSGQFEAQIEGRFLDYEQDGRDLYYNIGCQNVMINHDRIGAAQYQAKGISIESTMIGNVKWTVALSGQSDDLEVLSWMELTEQFKINQG